MNVSLLHEVGFLILFPMIVAALLLIPVKSDRLRMAIVSVASVALIGVSVALLFGDYGKTGALIETKEIGAHRAELAGTVMLWVELALAALIVFISIRAKKFLVTLLMAAQAGLMLWFEHANKGKLETANAFFVDKLSVIMALIIGIIGCLICVYAVGYMKDFHHHYRTEVKDRRPFFFFILFVFLGAMFGIVFANNLLWLYFFWEITTLSSFVLIGYKGDKESKDNAYRALLYNLLGGVAFAIAIVVVHGKTGSIGMDGVLAAHKDLVILPVMLISFAGMTKSAQLPFSKWLLGAMVAPTPVSALLHSSTMVKAGVYVIVRLSPVLCGTQVGKLVALVGGVTFLVTSLLAVSQSNAKKVLAYSTIANLGLIVMCGGIGTAEAVWAAVMLIIFHAVAKGLLFLCVGVVEHKIHSRDIEDMSGLIITMPKLSVMMQIGMAGMFLAPFGMLISKWAAMKALIDCNALLVVFVVFGSAVTLLFWVKWMGKLLQITKPGAANVEGGISGGEWTALGTLAVMTVGACLFFPLLSSRLVDPFVQGAYGTTMNLGAGNIIIMLIMLGMVALFPLSFLHYGRKVRVADPYLAGANTAGGVKFTGSAGAVHEMGMKNYYLEPWFGENRLFMPGALVSTLLIALMMIEVMCK